MPHFVTKHNLNLAITVSALKALLCDAWLMNEAKLALPVTVRRCLIEGTGSASVRDDTVVYGNCLYC
jgi:hypothetical protein